MEDDEEHQPEFTLEELVDLALSSPEIGTVNFNILRLLLHDIVEKLGIEAMPVTLGEVEHNHVEHYKSYISGNSQTTPLPGVLRVTAPGYSYGVKSQLGTDGAKNVVAASPSIRKTPRTPKTGRDSVSKGTGTEPNATANAASGGQNPPTAPAGTTTTAPAGSNPPGAPTLPQTVTSPRLLDATKALEDKVSRLERHLDALYQLPTNQQLLDGKNGKDGASGGTGGGMTVNDMWQIIQLNNRVASCESAIQKMATLIEDLATDLSRMKGDNKSFQNDAENLIQSHSRLSTDLSPLPEKCQMVQDALDELKKDLNGIRDEWKNELDKITKAVGLDPTNMPSFMKTTGSHTKTHHDGKSKHDQHNKKDTHSAPTSANGDDDGDTENMTDEQKAAADKKKAEKKSVTKNKKNPNNMKPKEISKLTEEEIDELEPEEAAAIKPSKLVHMSPKQLKKIEEVKKRKGKVDLEKMSPEEIASLSPSQLALLTPEQRQKVEEVKSKLTPEQQKKVEEMKSKGGKGGGHKDSKELTSSEIENLTPSQAENLTDEQLSNMTPEQKELLEKLKSKEPGTDSGSGGSKDKDHGHGPAKKSVVDGGHGLGKKSTVDGHGPTPDDPKKHKGIPSRHRIKGGHGQGQGHVNVDILKGTIPKNQALPPMNQDETKDLVQAELQKQYGQLQTMQRQMAKDMQEKMEFIYDKLLKEIVAQNDGALPYMAVGAPVEALGPGVCTGAGMPAGIAVCQFPEAGGRHPGPTENKVCPGPGLCPANEDCPNCSTLAAKGGQGGHGGGPPVFPQAGVVPDIRAPGKEVTGTKQTGLGAIGTQREPYAPGKPRTSDGYSPLSYAQGPTIQSTGTTAQSAGPKNADEQILLREMKSLILLDLEKIRNDMKIRDINTFDEQDMVERLDTVWEAIKIIKNNEETLAVKILRQDAFLKKLPKDTIDKLHKIPPENLEAIASAKWDKPMMLPSGTAVAGRSAGPPGGRRQSQGQGSKNASGPDSSAMDKEEVQKIYNNLSNLIAETTEHKNKLDRLGDQMRTMEVGMVTKQMLVDALGDKADKGQINTKVSYDEFGTAIEELHTNLRDLVVENFNKNEHWYRVTNDLAESVQNKLDKNELAPVKTFFKNHLKSLGDKVNHLQKKIDEPDPAGTRKKILKDFNCISCDRRCNISGVTNAPTLPTIGPILAAHTTASRRAFDLHRMRNKNKLLEDCRDMTLMERQLKCLGLLNPDGSAIRASDLDLVNRFHGGSHTAITNASRIRSQRGGSTSKPVISGAGSSYVDEEEMPDEDVIIGSSELLNGFKMPDEDLEQAEETESLLQSYVPAYIDE